MLSAVLLFPLFSAFLVLILPKKEWIRTTALVLSLVEFAVALVMYSKFDATTPALQLVEQKAWVEGLGIQYFLALDGINLWLIMLTAFLQPLVILGSWKSIEKRVRAFHICLFVLQTAMIGTFLAFDAILFYVFWELSLIPMYFLIGVWGGARRIYATMKFFIFTMAGSVLMLLAMIYLMYLCQESLGYMSSSLLDFYKLKIPFVAGTFASLQTILFFAFALAFSIKVPLFPVHTWLPDAHVEAPTPGSVILAGVMLKMGTYCFLRWIIPLFPEATEQFSWLFLLLGTIGIIYGALVAMVQPDIKKLVAYSSVSHMGYVIVGLFVLNHYGFNGSLFQMLSHGVSTGGLFFLIGMIYERTHSREISDYGGLAAKMPIYTIFFFIITLASVGAPLTSGFIGEFLVLFGTFQTNPAFASVAVLGVILGAVYMLWMFKKVFFGPEGRLVSDTAHPLKDLSCREILVLAPLIILVFWMGVFPNTFLKKSEVSLKYLLENKNSYNLQIKENR